MTSDALEEWHRYCLPAFTDRMPRGCGLTARTATKCGPPRGGTLDTAATHTVVDESRRIEGTPTRCAMRQPGPRRLG